MSDTLRAVDVPIMTDEKCREAYEDMIDESMICAGYAEGGKDSCQVKYKMTDKLFFSKLPKFCLNHVFFLLRLVNRSHVLAESHKLWRWRLG